MSGQRISIEFDVMEFRDRFSVDISDFHGMTPEQIEREVREKVSEFAAANVSFFPENIAGTVKEIQDALAAEAREEEELEHV